MQMETLQCFLKMKKLESRKPAASKACDRGRVIEREVFFDVANACCIAQTQGERGVELLQKYRYKSQIIRPVEKHADVNRNLTFFLY